MMESLFSPGRLLSESKKLRKNVYRLDLHNMKSNSRNLLLKKNRRKYSETDVPLAQITVKHQIFFLQQSLKLTKNSSSLADNKDSISSPFENVVRPDVRYEHEPILENLLIETLRYHCFYPHSLVNVCRAWNIPATELSIKYQKNEMYAKDSEQVIPI